MSYKYTIGILCEYLIIFVFIIIGRKILNHRLKIKGSRTEIDIISYAGGITFITEVKFRVIKNNALQAWNPRQAQKLMKVAQLFKNVNIEYIACWFVGYKRFIINIYDIPNWRNSCLL